MLKWYGYKNGKSIIIGRIALVIVIAIFNIRWKSLFIFQYRVRDTTPRLLINMEKSGQVCIRASYKGGYNTHSQTLKID